MYVYFQKNIGLVLLKKQKFNCYSFFSLAPKLHKIALIWKRIKVRLQQRMKNEWKCSPLAKCFLYDSDAHRWAWVLTENVLSLSLSYVRDVNFFSLSRYQFVKLLSSLIYNVERVCVWNEYICKIHKMSKIKWNMFMWKRIHSQRSRFVAYC